MSGEKQTPTQRLTNLCRRMEEAGVDGYIVLSSDAHLNEYVPEYTRRRTAITGFRGSAGDVLVFPDKTHLFVDPRYHLQADDEVDQDRIRVHKLGMAGEKTLGQWLTETEKERGSIRVGFDPFVVSTQAYAAYKAALNSPDSELVPLEDNLVDAVWEDQPPPPANPIYALGDELTGCSVADKLASIRKEMEEAGATLLVLTKLDEIAWVTNLRGTDIAYNPVFEGYMIIDMERATCFTRTSPPPEVLDGLDGSIGFEPYEAYAEKMKRIGAEASGRIWLDPRGVTMGTRLMLHEDQQVHERPNPIVALKAIKNDTEIAASRNSHRHAAAAKIRSFRRLQDSIRSGETVSEEAYSDLLYEEYSSEEGFYDLSFTTIAAAGSNGAIIHYADASPDVPLRDGELFLVDSGVQLLGGTTDDTRTVIVGTPSERQKAVYTLVLKGHINLAMQKFPEGTGGVALDALARSHLWNAGLDYGHGTGHGVGAFLNVHEGPQSITARSGDETFKVGMIVSNEPGYYEAGWGGVRLENLYVVAPDDEMPGHPDGRKWMRFDPLTLIPFDKRLIDWDRLTDGERAWLEGYHQEVWETIGPMLEDDDREWLREACQPSHGA